MKAKSTLLIIGMITFNLFAYQLLQAQFVRGNGNVTESKREISSFSSVEVGSGIDLYITQGDKESITLEADENIHQYIETEVDGGNLKIYLSKKVRKVKTMQAHLTIKTIKGIHASGGSDVYSKNIIKSEVLSVICSGGSDAKLEIEVDEFKCKVSGGSDADIKGSTKKLAAQASGGSDIYAGKLKSIDCHVETSGGSDAKVNATGKLIARATGGSDVSYSGNPEQVDAKATGGGDISRIPF